MKKNILKAMAVLFACGVAGSIGCMGSSGGGGCGGGSTPATTTSLSCGSGTHQVGSTCVANNPSGSGSGGGSNGTAQSPTLTTQSIKR